MTVFLIGFFFGLFMGAFAANKNFRTKIIKEVRKLSRNLAAKYDHRG